VQEASEMDKDQLWERFAATGKIADYLNYCGVLTPPAKEGTTSGTENRGTDRPREQQSGGS